MIRIWPLDEGDAYLVQEIQRVRSRWGKLGRERLIRSQVVQGEETAFDLGNAWLAEREAKPPDVEPRGA